MLEFVKNKKKARIISYVLYLCIQFNTYNKLCQLPEYKNNLLSILKISILAKRKYEFINL